MGWTPPHPNGINVPDWKRYRPVNVEKGSTMKLMRVGVDLAKAVFQLVLHQRTARSLGLRFPQALLLRADEIIQ